MDPNRFSSLRARLPWPSVIILIVLLHSQGTNRPSKLDWHTLSVNPWLTCASSQPAHIPYLCGDTSQKGCWSWTLWTQSQTVLFLVGLVKLLLSPDVQICLYLVGSSPPWKWWSCGLLLPCSPAPLQQQAGLQYANWKSTDTSLHCCPVTEAKLMLLADVVNQGVLLFQCPWLNCLSSLMSPKLSTSCCLCSTSFSEKNRSSWNQSEHYKHSRVCYDCTASEGCYSLLHEITSVACTLQDISTSKYPHGCVAKPLASFFAVGKMS